MSNQLRHDIGIVFSELEKLNRTGETHVYFSGSINPQQSEFERQCNHLQIGVVARNDFVGWALLRFVKMLKMNSLFLFRSDFNKVLNEKKNIKPMDLICHMANQEYEYGERFDPADTFKVTLHADGKDCIVENSLADVDIWTLPRVKNGISDFNLYH